MEQYFSVDFCHRLIGTICNSLKCNHRLMIEIIGCPQLFSKTPLLNFMPFHRCTQQCNKCLLKAKNNPAYHILSNYAVPCTKSGLLFEVKT